MKRRLFLLSLGPLALTASGCGAGSADLARQSALERRLDAHVIDKPLDEVMQTVALIDAPTDEMLWNGSSFTWSQAGPGKMKTSRRSLRDDHGDAHRVEVRWFECEAESVGDGTRAHFFEVTVTSSAQGLHETSRKRRTDIELELVRRFDPRAADRIEAAGDHAAASGK